MSNKRNYRNRIYPTYTSLYTPDAVEISNHVLEANAKVFASRIKGWLPMNKRSSCLDVACGAGGVLFALRTEGYKNLRGVDCSSQQVSVAEKICPAVEQGDAIDYLKRNQGTFDLITAFDIIEHFAKEEVFEFLDALYAALKPGGRLIIQTPNAESPWFGAVRYGDFTHEVAFTPASLGRVLKAAGFFGYAAQECRPYFHGIKSGMRLILWSLIRTGIIVWNLIETGSRGSGVVTRVFIAKADKSA